MKNSPVSKIHLAQPGVVAALLAALLFGAGMPLAKLLLADLDPVLLAGRTELFWCLGWPITHSHVHFPDVHHRHRHS